MTRDRILVDHARRVPAKLQRALELRGSPGAVLLREALEHLGCIEERLGSVDPERPAREVVRRYLARLRAAVEDVLVRRLREDPGCEEILAGEVLPLSEGLEGLCRTLAAEALGAHPAGPKET